MVDIMNIVAVNEEGTLYVYCPILDEDLPSLPKLEALGRMVADLVSTQHRVLVHCRMGLNRSNLVIATALTYLGLSGDQAVVRLHSLRPGALFNETFAAHVRTLATRLRQSSCSSASR